MLDFPLSVQLCGDLHNAMCLLIQHKSCNDTTVYMPIQQVNNLWTQTDYWHRADQDHCERVKSLKICLSKGLFIADLFY